jgi:hypothetical protein
MAERASDDEDAVRRYCVFERGPREMQNAFRIHRDGVFTFAAFSEGRRMALRQVVDDGAQAAPFIGAIKRAVQRERPDLRCTSFRTEPHGATSRRYGFGVVDGAGVGLVAGALVVAGAGGSVGWRAQYTTTPKITTTTAAIAYQRRLSKFIATSRTGCRRNFG